MIYKEIGFPCDPQGKIFQGRCYISRIDEWICNLTDVRTGFRMRLTPAAEGRRRGGHLWLFSIDLSLPGVHQHSFLASEPSLLKDCSLTTDLL